MTDLEFDISIIADWFEDKDKDSFIHVNIGADHAVSLSEILSAAFRRCYISDEKIEERVQKTGRSKAELIAAVLPDPGATMSGDFGEIMVFLYHAANEIPCSLVGPKKWRLKQDRNKPAPFSDVVHFYLPSWPEASKEDRIMCSEVKAKATAGTSTPITNAIKDCEKDRTSRLNKTLLWLRERALIEDLGSTTIEHLDRFINAIDYPPADKKYHAVAVICSSLVKDELSDAPEELSKDYTVVIIEVPDLKDRYEEMYRAIITAATEQEIVQ